MEDLNSYNITSSLALICIVRRSLPLDIFFIDASFRTSLKVFKLRDVRDVSRYFGRHVHDSTCFFAEYCNWLNVLYHDVS